MATIPTLLERGELVKITVRLKRGEQPGRYIYGFPEFLGWLNNDLPNLETGRLQADASPKEQMNNLLYRWISDKQMNYGRMLNDLMPKGSETWEMKTPDLRVFGWIYRPKIFIALFGDYADLYKGKNRSVKPVASYAKAVRRVIAARSQLDLDEPKYESGVYDGLV